jgi:hypothetical protein
MVLTDRNFNTSFFEAAGGDHRFLITLYAGISLELLVLIFSDNLKVGQSAGNQRIIIVLVESSETIRVTS